MSANEIVRDIYGDDDLNLARFAGAIRAYASIKSQPDDVLMGLIREEVRLFEAAENRRRENPDGAS